MLPEIIDGLETYRKMTNAELEQAMAAALAEGVFPEALLDEYNDRPRASARSLSMTSLREEIVRRVDYLAAPPGSDDSQLATDIRRDTASTLVIMVEVFVERAGEYP